MNYQNENRNDSSPAQEQAHIVKAARDNRADQMNPNNWKYHKARKKDWTNGRVQTVMWVNLCEFPESTEFDFSIRGRLGFTIKYPGLGCRCTQDPDFANNFRLEIPFRKQLETVRFSD